MQVSEHIRYFSLRNLVAQKDMIEPFLGLIGELVLQVLCESVADYLIRSLSEPFCRRPAAAFAFAGYCSFGAVAGGCSLMLAPYHFIATPWQQVANLIVL